MPLFLSRPSICFILIYPENSLNKPEDVDKYKRKRLKNIPHEQVFRGCTIIGILFDSWIGKQSKQIDMRCCLSVASSSNDYDNITAGLRAQDVFSGFSFIRPDQPPLMISEINWRIRIPLRNGCRSRRTCGDRSHGISDS